MTWWYDSRCRYRWSIGRCIDASDRLLVVGRWWWYVGWLIVPVVDLPDCLHWWFDCRRWFCRLTTLIGHVHLLSSIYITSIDLTSHHIDLTLVSCSFRYVHSLIPSTGLHQVIGRPGWSLSIVTIVLHQVVGGWPVIWRQLSDGGWRASCDWRQAPVTGGPDTIQVIQVQPGWSIEWWANNDLQWPSTLIVDCILIARQVIDLLLLFVRLEVVGDVVVGMLIPARCCCQLLCQAPGARRCQAPDEWVDPASWPVDCWSMIDWRCPGWSLSIVDHIDAR